MKNCLLLLLLALLVAVAASANNKYYVRKANKYMKKIGLEKHEMYFVEKQDIVDQYITPDGSMNFPMNYVYNEDGLRVKAKYQNGDVKDIMNCFGVFADDFSAYVHDTGNLTYITADNSLKDETQYFQPVFNDAHVDKQKESLIVYYPAGLPFVKKSYKELIERVKYHREKGKDLNVYFVMVRIMEHVETD